MVTEKAVAKPEVTQYHKLTLKQYSLVNHIQ